jgi:hypothetical protein
MQASIMAAALAGLAATCARALQQEERHALSGRPGPARPRSGLVDATAAAENSASTAATATSTPRYQRTLA